MSNCPSLETSRATNPLQPEEGLPTVSVVIPVRNEERWIAGCLEALIRNCYPRHLMEVLVVDGMSQDRTREIAQGFGGKDLKFRVIPNPKLTRSAALNLGIQEAQGQIIMRLDARVMIPPDYVQRCVKALSATNADNVGGVQKPIAKTPTQEAIGLAMSAPFGVGNAQFRLGRKSGFVDTVYLGCFRRELFSRIGLFDDVASVISEDSDINQRIRENGGLVYLDASIEAYYYPRERLWDLMRLYFRYGGARMGNILKHGKPSAWRQLVPPIFVTALAVLAVGGLFHPSLLLVFAVLIVAYGITDFAVAALLTRGRKISIFPRLVMAFPCIHFAFASGFFRRLLQRPKPEAHWGY